jgi:hypothetical protein
VASDWNNTQETHFWHERAPHEVKFEIEKLTGQLLTRDPAAAKLTYRGSATIPNPFEIELRFEAVLPRVPYVMKRPTERSEFKNLYALRLCTNGPGKAFDHWCLYLQCCATVTDFSDHSQIFYDQQVRESIEVEETRARRVEDPDPILAAQKRVLAALRDGKQFRNAHHEGGSTLYFNGKTFLREDYGEYPDRREFATDAEMLACIRQFFDWESRRETYPHQPAELDVWKYIERQLR